MSRQLSTSTRSPASCGSTDGEREPVRTVTPSAPPQLQQRCEARHAVRDHAERRAGVVGPGDRDLDDRPAVGLDLSEQLDVEGESRGPALREGPGDRVAVEELEA